MVLYGAFGEHIGLALQIALVVQHLQGAKRRIGGILIEREAVARAGQKPVFLRELVVKAVQVGLLRFHRLVARAVQLQINELSGAVAYGNHASDALRRHPSQLHAPHAGVFTVIGLVALHGKTEISHIGICGDGFDLHIIRVLSRHIEFQQLPVGRRNVLDCLRKLFGKHRALDGFTGGFRVVAVQARAAYHFPQHHLRVRQIVAVERYSIFGFRALHPLRQLLRGTVTLLENENIRRDLGARVVLKGIVRQADRAQQVSLLRQRLAYLAVFLVHRALAGDKGHDAARSRLVECFHQEVIMDEKILLVVPLVMDVVAAKRHVADRKIKEVVRVVGMLKPVHGDVDLLIELLGDAPRQAVQLHAVELRV